MKYTIALCALLLCLPGRSAADALDKTHVSADAKWLVHLDLDNLRQTHIGTYLIEQYVAPHVAQVGDQFKLNATNLLQRIRSVTAYGADFKTGADGTGVLLINSDADTQKALVGLLAAQVLANTNGPVKKLADTEHDLYSFANQVFLSPQPGGPIVVSRSEEQIEAARDLLAGKGASLASTKRFNEYPTVADSFFFVALADAVNLPNAIPAQAKILQMAEGGRVALGEKADNVFLNISLRGKTADVTRQIQQVVEGMLALVSLGQPDNPDLMELAKSTKVSSTDQVMTVSVAYPASKVLDKLQEVTSPKPEKMKVAHQKKSPKLKHKPATQPQPEAEQPEPDKESKESKESK